MFDIHFIRFPNATAKVCFSKAHVKRVLRYRGWTRDEARAACDIFVDQYPGRWIRMRLKRENDHPRKILAVSMKVNQLTFKRIKEFWHGVPDVAAVASTDHPNANPLRAWEPPSPQLPELC